MTANNVNLKAYTEAADKILAGRISFFLTYNFGDVPNWNYDVAADKKTPVSFGKGIDYRNSDLVSDIKYVWELNRQLHLNTLAQAFALTEDKKYSEALNKHLSSWLDQCPYPQGLNWTSSLELGVRLINWSTVWQWVYADRVIYCFNHLALLERIDKVAQDSTKDFDRRSAETKLQ